MINAKCTICGYDGTTEKDKFGNYILFWSDEPICMACREDYALELDIGLKLSSLRE